MVKQGCKCRDAREQTIMLKHVDPIKDAFKDLNKIPTGKGPADIAMYIVNRLATSDPDTGLFANLKSVGYMALFWTIRGDCCASYPGFPDFNMTPFDLYKKRPTIANLGINDVPIELDIEN